MRRGTLSDVHAQVAPMRAGPHDITARPDAIAVLAGRAAAWGVIKASQRDETEMEPRS